MYDKDRITVTEHGRIIRIDEDIWKLDCIDRTTNQRAMEYESFVEQLDIQLVNAFIDDDLILPARDLYEFDLAKILSHALACGLYDKEDERLFFLITHVLNDCVC